MAISRFSRCFLAITCVLWLVPANLLVAQVDSRSLGWYSDAIRSEPLEDGGWSPVVTNVCLQPGGNLVAVVGDDHSVQLYDRSTGRLQKHLIEHTDWVRAARFSRDGRFLATAGNDRQLILWDLQREAHATKLAQHDSAIADLAFSHDGSRVATVGFESKLRIYECRQRTSALRAGLRL